MFGHDGGVGRRRSVAARRQPHPPHLCPVSLFSFSSELVGDGSAARSINFAGWACSTRRGAQDGNIQGAGHRCADTERAPMVSLCHDDALLGDANWLRSTSGLDCSWLRSTSGLQLPDDDCFDPLGDDGLDLHCILAEEEHELARAERQGSLLAEAPTPVLPAATGEGKRKKTTSSARTPGKGARRARGGGNFSKVSEDGARRRREICVRKDRNGIALFELTTGNEDKIQRMIRWIQEAGIETWADGLCHPCLHLRALSLTSEEYDRLARELFGHRGGSSTKAFRSFLCYLGLRPAHKPGSPMMTFDFDADGWNRQGYRLGKGGVPARGDGKPKIVFV